MEVPLRTRPLLPYSRSPDGRRLFFVYLEKNEEPDAKDAKEKQCIEANTAQSQVAGHQNTKPEGKLIDSFRWVVLAGVPNEHGTYKNQGPHCIPFERTCHGG